MDTRYGQSLDIGKLLGSEDNSVDKKPVAVEETNGDKPSFVSKNSAPFLSDKNLVRVMLFFLIILSIFVLIQPQNLDRIDTSVRNSLIAQYEQQAVVDVLKEFPEASVQQKRAFVEKKVYEMLQHPDFKERVNSVAEHYKSFYRDNTGQTLLYSADPYYYFRLVRNLVESGIVTGDIKERYFREGDQDVLKLLPVDSLRFFPFGDEVSAPNLLPHVVFYFFRAVNYVVPSVSLLTATFYFPVVAGVISVLLVFLIGQRVSGFNAGFFSALAFLLHPVFLFWNYAGYADTHILAMTFSLASVLLFIYGIDFSHKFRAVICLSGLSAAIYFILYPANTIWSGLFFIPVLFVVTCAIFLINGLARKVFFAKKYGYLKWVVLVVIVSGWFVYDVVANYSERLLIMLNIINVPEVFPTAFSSITELEGAKTIRRFVTALGGGIFVLLLFIEFILFLKSLKDKIEIKTLLLWVWLGFFIVPAFLSARFLFFVIPPMALIVGRAFASMSFLSEKLFSSVLKLRLSSFAVRLLSTVLVLAVVFLIVNPSPLVAKTKLPLVTKSFVEAAEYILSESRSDAVIFTAFDLGYAWQAFSRRATFFDGGLFRTPRDYWISDGFISDNENRTANIARILSCGYDHTHSGVYSSVDRLSKLNKILSAAHNSINKNNSGDGELEKIYCDNNSEIFFGITESMIYQMHLFDYYKNWDFNAAQTRQNIRGRSFDNAVRFLQSSYNLSEDAAVEAYDSAKSFEEVIPPKHVGEIAHCKKNDKMILCNDGLAVLLPSLNATIEGVYPKSLVFVKDGKRTVVQFKNSRETFSAVVYQSGSEFRSILMDTELVDTMLVRMFTGENLSLFEPVFISAEKPDRVVVYKMKS